jgi:hypothetical protein
MADERQEVTGSELARWIIIAVLVVAGLAAALWLAPGTEPIAPPVRESDS